MLTSVIPIRLAARRLTGGALLVFLAGCAGDSLLLPRDGAPAELRMVSGDRQRATAGDLVEEPLVVEALDGVRPVAGVVVLFEFVDSPAGAEIAPENTETDSAGRASVEVRLGTAVGDQDVEARLNDPASDLAVQFRLTALQPPGGGGDGGGGGGDDDGGGGGPPDDGGGGGGGGGPPDNGGGHGDDDDNDD